VSRHDVGSAPVAGSPLLPLVRQLAGTGADLARVSQQRVPLDPLGAQQDQRAEPLCTQEKGDRRPKPALHLVVVAERGGRLALAALQHLGELGGVVDPPHPLAAAARHRLDQHRIPDLVGLLGKEFRFLPVAVIAGEGEDQGDAASAAAPPSAASAGSPPSSSPWSAKV